MCCSACELVAGLLRPRIFPFGKLSKLKSAAQGFCVRWGVKASLWYRWRKLDFKHDDYRCLCSMLYIFHKTSNVLQYKSCECMCVMYTRTRNTLEDRVEFRLKRCYYLCQQDSWNSRNSRHSANVTDAIYITLTFRYFPFPLVTGWLELGGGGGIYFCYLLAVSKCFVSQATLKWGECLQYQLLDTFYVEFVRK